VGTWFWVIQGCTAVVGVDDVLGSSFLSPPTHFAFESNSIIQLSRVARPSGLRTKQNQGVSSFKFFEHRHGQSFFFLGRVVNLIRPFPPGTSRRLD